MTFLISGVIWKNYCSWAHNPLDFLFKTNGPFQCTKFHKWCSGFENTLFRICLFLNRSETRGFRGISPGPISRHSPAVIHQVAKQLSWQMCGKSCNKVPIQSLFRSTRTVTPVFFFICAMWESLFGCTLFSNPPAQTQTEESHCAAKCGFRQLDCLFCRLSEAEQFEARTSSLSSSP